MTILWCPVCHARHAAKRDCPGELLATGPERHGWRVLVRTPTCAEVYGILIAEAGRRWRARILTYPNMLWSVPGGRHTMKFVAETAQEAEGQAVEFVLDHCRVRGYTIADEIASVETQPFAREDAAELDPRAARDSRFLRSMVIRFGEEQIDRLGMTADLSGGGLFIITDRPLAAGSSIKMLLELDQYTVPLKGKVAWQRSRAGQGRPAGMGVQLNNPPHLYARCVRNLDADGD